MEPVSTLTVQIPHVVYAINEQMSLVAIDEWRSRHLLRSAGSGRLSDERDGTLTLGCGPRESNEKATTKLAGPFQRKAQFTDPEQVLGTVRTSIE